jgi:DNA-binding protein YbaB
VTNPDEALGRVQRVVADYPQQVAEARSRVAAAAAAEVAGEDLGGLVRVTATGKGDIIAVRVTGRALRDLDARALAERITEAANAALARAEAMLTDAARTSREADDTAYAMARFTDRMDDLLDRLTRLDRDLEDRLGELGGQ